MQFKYWLILELKPFKLDLNWILRTWFLKSLSACCSNGRRLWAGSLSQDWQMQVVKTNVSILTKRLVAFSCTPESWQFGHLKRHHAFSINFWLLQAIYCSKVSDHWQFCCFHSIVNSVFYLCAKFGALDPRINEIRYGGNRFQLVLQVQTCTLTVPSIFWLSNLVLG
jgi:hypothetical protein